MQNKLITKAVVFYEFLFMFFAADGIGSLREILIKKKYHGSEQMEIHKISLPGNQRQSMINVILF